MEYTTLPELKMLEKVNKESINGVCEALNKSFNTKKLDEEQLLKALDELDVLVEKAAPGRFVRIHVPGECKYLEKGDEVKKAIDTSKLRAKRVQVTNKKTGKTFTTTRYVKQDSDESEKTGLKTKITTADFEGDDVATLDAIVNSDSPKSQKIRDLLELGIYDRKVILAMSEAAPTQLYTELNKLDLIGETKPSTSGGTGEDMPDEEEDGFPPADMSSMSQKKVRQIMEKQRKKRREEAGISYKAFWDMYEETLEGVIERGYPKSLIAYGTGGLGKTFTLDQVKNRLEVREYDEEVDPAPDQYDSVTIKGTTGLRDMWSIIVKNRDKLLVFDDADSMWGTGKEEHQNILKGMLDTSGDGTVRYGNAGKDPVTGEQMPKQIKFTGQVIFISNLERKDFPQPLISSRCGAIDLTMTKDETLDKLNDLKYLIKLHGKGGKEIEIPEDSRDAAYKFFVDNKDELSIGSINGRMFAQVADVHAAKKRRGDLKGWEQAAMIRTNLV